MTFRFDLRENDCEELETANAANPLTQAREPGPKGTELTLISELAGKAGEDEQSSPSTRRQATRRQRFAALGFADALELAEALAIRDADRDERRLCVECSHCRRTGCAKGDAWLPRILQRCDRFSVAALQMEEEAE